MQNPRLRVVRTGPETSEEMGAVARNPMVGPTAAAVRRYRGLFLVPAGARREEQAAMPGYLQAARIVAQVEREIAAQVEREREVRHGLRVVTAEEPVEPESLWARVQRAFGF